MQRWRVSCFIKENSPKKHISLIAELPIHLTGLGTVHFLRGRGGGGWGSPPKKRLKGGAIPKKKTEGGEGATRNILVHVELT